MRLKKSTLQKVFCFTFLALIEISSHLVLAVDVKIFLNIKQPDALVSSALDEISNSSYNIGEVVSIPIAVSNVEPEMGIVNIDFNLKWSEKAGFKNMEFELTSLGKEWLGEAGLFDFNIKPSRIQVSTATINALSQDGTIAVIKFKATSAGKFDLIVEKFWANEKPVKSLEIVTIIIMPMTRIIRKNRLAETWGKIKK